MAPATSRSTSTGSGAAAARRGHITCRILAREPVQVIARSCGTSPATIHVITSSRSTLQIRAIALRHLNSNSQTRWHSSTCEGVPRSALVRCGREVPGHRPDRHASHNRRLAGGSRPRPGIRGHRANHVRARRTTPPRSSLTATWVPRVARLSDRRSADALRAAWGACIGARSQRVLRGSPARGVRSGGW